jgi:hypothetical protein
MSKNRSLTSYYSPYLEKIKDAFFANVNAAASHDYKISKKQLLECGLYIIFIGGFFLRQAAAESSGGFHDYHFTDPTNTSFYKLSAYFPRKYKILPEQQIANCNGTLIPANSEREFAVLYRSMSANGLSGVHDPGEILSRGLQNLAHAILEECVENVMEPMPLKDRQALGYMMAGISGVMLLMFLVAALAGILFCANTLIDNCRRPKSNHHSPPDEGTVLLPVTNKSFSKK